ncbi:hypothetical protein [Bosea sp. UNC402CLCol]|uniref:hypothetical protein n=1 Tax=Bosea sp. UNC402CLCol TaxID=1510531 RepID=UPI00068EF6BF|nr:hypothetical protein [Bosea sp. UNC402CLCol]
MNAHAIAIPGYLGPADDLASRIAAIGEGDIPTSWTPEHVQNRMVEAFDILARSGTRVGPRQHANGWPAMIHEFSDLVDAQARALAEKERQQERAARPTADELSRMNEALKWPMTYLDGRPMQSDALMLWAYATALGRDMAAMLHHRKKKAKALADEIMRRHNAPPHLHDGKVMDTRDRAVLEAYERRVEIAREVAKITNDALARASKTTHGQIKAHAQSVFRARCLEEGCLPLAVKPHEAVPGRCLSRTNLDRQRKAGAAAVAGGLRRQGVAVR